MSGFFCMSQPCSCIIGRTRRSVMRRIIAAIMIIAAAGPVASAESGTAGTVRQPVDSIGYAIDSTQVETVIAISDSMRASRQFPPQSKASTRPPSPRSAVSEVWSWR